MSVSAPQRSLRRGPAWVRVVLLAALLLGLGAMHTLGHPQDGAHGGGEQTTVTGAGADAPSAHSAGELPDFDPSSVCLAIGGLVAALLGVAAVAFARRPEAFFRAVVLLLRRPVPCIAFFPDPPSLAELQVLRI